MIQKITDQNFQSQVLQNKNIAIVIFSQTWNAGSNFLEKHLNDLDAIFDNKISLFKMDVERNIKTIEKFMIYDFPSTFIFKNGELIEIFSGLYSRKKILNVILNNMKD